MTSRTCRIGDAEFGSERLALIAGPCMAESLELCLEVAAAMRDICRRLDIAYVFKASYDKANRSSGAGFRGPGLETGLEWLTRVRSDLGVPVISDIHEAAQAAPAGAALDAVQIPAFLCRQTDLLLAAGEAAKAVNVKKGQFMSPQEMKLAVDKLASAGNTNVMLTERGTFFGYNRLVSDFRAIPQMRQYAPVAFDATHSVQQPGGLGEASGGERQYAGMLASAAMAVGADALFIETHPNPEQAKSDAAVQIPLDQMEPLLRRCLAIRAAAR